MNSTPSREHEPGDDSAVLRRRLAELEQAERRRDQAEAALRAQARQQAVVSELGQRALAGETVAALFDEATRLVAQTLGVEQSAVLEYLPGRDALRLRAGVGWRTETVGDTIVPTGRHDPAGLALVSGTPVVIDDLATDRRFAAAAIEFLREHGVVSGVSVTIVGRERPYGVLEAYATRQLRFRNNHIEFLRAIANVLAAAIDRAQGEDELAESEQRFRALVELAPDIIFSCELRDGSDALAALNPAFEAITGWTREEWLGRPFADLVHPDDRDMLRARWSQLVGGEQCAKPFEARIVGRDGALTPVEVRVVPWIEDRGAATVFGIGRDIAARKHAEEELRNSRDELAIILEGVGDAITVQEPGGRIRYANAAAAQLLGCSTPEELLATPLGEIMSRFEVSDAAGNHMPVEQLPGRQVLRGAPEAEATLRVRNADGGAERWSVIKALPVLADDGSLRFAINIFHDITERIRTQLRERFLADASAALSASLDYATTLASIARLSVPTVADWCVVNVVADDGRIERLAYAHVDPQREHLLRRLQERYPPRADLPQGIAQVIRSGEPLLTTEVSDASLRAAASDDEHLALLREIGVRSAMVVPIIDRERVLGAISFGSGPSGRRFGADDLSLAAELAHRAAMAIDNASLYRSATNAVERLRTLARVSESFATARLDLDAVLATLARQVVAAIGDACVIRLLAADGDTLDAVALAHRDPAVEAALREMARDTPQSVHDGYQGQVARSGAPILVQDTTASEFEASLMPAHREWFRRTGVHSMVIVPLRVGGANIGTMAILRDASSHALTGDDQAFAQDLADRAALAIDSARRFGEAQAAARQRIEFLSIASHELKTPLTSVKAATQLLNRWLGLAEPDIERALRVAGQLQREVLRLEELVLDLLDASRIQQGRVELRRAPLDLAELARQAVERFHDAPERTAVHTFALDASAPVIGDWDAARLDQVLTNLLSNALKYAPDGGEVRVSVTGDADTARLTVRDSGMGIAPDELARLFQPFVRGAFAQSHVGGTGLGLYISAQIIEQHGGKIEVDSAPGQGSAFIVVLPRATRPHES